LVHSSTGFQNGHQHDGTAQFGGAVPSGKPPPALNRDGGAYLSNRCWQGRGIERRVTRRCTDPTWGRLRARERRSGRLLLRLFLRKLALLTKRFQQLLKQRERDDKQDYQEFDRHALLLPARRARLVIVFFGDGLTHRGVGFDVFHAIVVHDAEIPFAERFSHGARNFGLGFDDASPHFLFQRDSHRPALFGFRLRDLFIRIRLIDLQFGPDIFAHIDVCDVD
jgi:hypothetical protein